MASNLYSLFLFGLFLCFLGETESLSCLGCDKASCPVPDCGVGNEHVSDMCGCCQLCAKKKYEQCAGIWNHAGTCGKGLTCKKFNPSDINRPGYCMCKPPVCEKYCPMGYALVVGHDKCQTCQCKRPSFTINKKDILDEILEDMMEKHELENIDN